MQQHFQEHNTPKFGVPPLQEKSLADGENTSALKKMCLLERYLNSTVETLERVCKNQDAALGGLEKLLLSTGDVATWE